MKILLISYFFAPHNNIGAVRPTKLAKYLIRMGHEVTVLCSGGRDGESDPALKRDMANIPNVHVVEEWNPIRDKKRARQKNTAPKAAAAPAMPQRRSLMKKGKDVVYQLIGVASDVSFRHRGWKYIRSLNQHYDVVLSTYGPWSVHHIACKVKRAGMAKHWAADFRDDVTVPFEWMNPWMKHYLRMICRHSDVRIGVSQGIMDKMGLGEDCAVLCNGFDPEDYKSMGGETVKTEKFTLAYCGQLSLGRRDVGNRDVTPIIQALHELVEEKVIAREEIELCYAGNDGAVFEAQAAAGGLADCVRNVGHISREQAMQLQLQANAIMVATWNLAGITGLLSGKLFEALMMNRPVLCSVRGDLPNSAMAQVIGETGAGYCYEEAVNDGLTGMKNYLCTLISMWREGKPAGEDVDRERLAFYSYPQIARRLIGFFDE